VVAVLAAVGAVLAFSAGDDDDEGDADVSLPELGRAIEVRGLGIRIERPSGWKASREAGAVKLTSPDRSTLIAVSAPGEADEAAAVFRDTLAAIRDGYEDVEVRLERPGRLGGLRAANASVQATNEAGGRLSALVAVARGEEHAYLVEVFAPQGGGELVEAQAVLSTGLRLSG
jgi:predicted Zn-dependent protease